MKEFGLSPNEYSCGDVGMFQVDGRYYSIFDMPHDRGVIMKNLDLSEYNLHKLSNLYPM